MRRVGKEYDVAMVRQFQRNILARSADLKRDSNSDSCQAEPQFVVFRATPLQQLIRAAIHAATFGIGYIIMLLAMYFNGYIIISIIIGAGIGKFFCDWMIQKVSLSGRTDGSREYGIEEPTICCG